MIRRPFASTPARRAARNGRRYRKWLDTLTPPAGADRADLRLVYTDREGNNYYVFADPLLMSVERSEKISEAVVASRFNVERADIISALASTMAAINAGDLARLRSETLGKLADLRHRLDRVGVEALVLEIAALFFITDNENPYTVNPLTTAEKRRRAAADDDLRVFFLTTIWEIYRKPADISAADFLSYLSIERITEGLSSHLRRP